MFNRDNKPMIALTLLESLFSLGSGYVEFNKGREHEKALVIEDLRCCERATYDLGRHDYGIRYI